MAAVAAIAIAWQAGRVGRGGEATPAPPVPEHRALRPATPGGPFHGMAVQLHGGTDIYEKYHRLIPEVAELGADTVLFVVHGWQTHGASLDLHIDARRTADAEQLGRLCDLATDSGLRIILMPIVLLESPRNNEWRGKIIPEGHAWDAWFRRYSRFIVHFARIAEKHRVELLMIGSELIKTETYADRWIRVIQEVRQNYRGQLGYSANWDHYQTSKIAFWPHLDYVGMTTYYELADAAGPDAAEIDANWAKIKSQIVAFAREVNKPIVFTEVGWCSQEGAAHEAWNYYANQKATAAGLREQALLYECFIRAWSDEPTLGGVIWWEWNTSPGGPGDYNYTPRAKPAEKILRRWFGDHGRRSDASTDGAGASASNGRAG
jgi:hypothetical protein